MCRCTVIIYIYDYYKQHAILQVLCQEIRGIFIYRLLHCIHLSVETVKMKGNGAKWFFITSFIYTTFAMLNMTADELGTGKQVVSEVQETKDYDHIVGFSKNPSRMGQNHDVTDDIRGENMAQIFQLSGRLLDRRGSVLQDGMVPRTGIILNSNRSESNEFVWIPDPEYRDMRFIDDTSEGNINQNDSVSDNTLYFVPNDPAADSLIASQTGFRSYILLTPSNFDTFTNNVDAVVSSVASSENKTAAVVLGNTNVQLPTPSEILKSPLHNYIDNEVSRQKMLVNNEKNLQICGSTYSSLGTSAESCHSRERQSTNILSTSGSQVVSDSIPTRVSFYGNEFFTNFGSFANLPPYSPVATLLQTPQYSVPVSHSITPFVPNFNYGYISPSSYYLPQMFSNCNNPATSNAVQNTKCHLQSGNDHVALHAVNRSLHVPFEQGSSGTKYIPILSKSSSDASQSNDMLYKRRDELPKRIRDQYQNFTVFWEKLNKMAQTQKETKAPRKTRKFTTKQLAEVIHERFFGRGQIKSFCLQKQVCRATHSRWAKRGLVDAMLRLAQEIANSWVDTTTVSNNYMDNKNGG